MKIGGTTIVVAVKGVLLGKGKVLILKRALDDYRSGTWECPGGKIDFGEGGLYDTRSRNASS
ncbi:NUDIX domain-containing protein [Robertmurraya sp. Marseille-Q9965]